MRNLEELNNKHKGKACFVIGSGPSINDCKKSPYWSSMHDHVTIAVNSGLVAFPASQTRS